MEYNYVYGKKSVTLVVDEVQIAIKILLVNIKAK